MKTKNTTPHHDRASALLLTGLLFSAFFASISIPAVAKDTEEVVEEAGDVQIVDAVDVKDTSTAAQSPTFLQIVGRNHAAAVHLPIGFLFALCLVEFARVASKKLSLNNCGLVLSIAAVLSFLPAALTGLLRANEVFSGREPPHLFFEHRNLMLSALGVLIVAVVLRIVKRNSLEGKLLVVYLALIGLALVLTAFGAHHGGMLVYGEQFLPY